MTCIVYIYTHQRNSKKNKACLIKFPTFSAQLPSSGGISSVNVVILTSIETIRLMDGENGGRGYGGLGGGGAEEEDYILIATLSPPE